MRDGQVRAMVFNLEAQLVVIHQNAANEVASLSLLIKNHDIMASAVEKTARRLQEITRGFPPQACSLAHDIAASRAPPPDMGEDLLDCEELLLERGYSAEECRRLAGELAKDLKLVAEGEGYQLQTVEQCFGPIAKHVVVFSRKDSRLIEDVITSFQQRPLHKRVVGNNTATKRRWELLETKGRGRGHARCIRTKR